jgi:hypothetical protein
MQTFQEPTTGLNLESYPSPLSYNLIFLTATIISIVSFPCMILLKKRTLLTKVSKVGESDNS